MCLIMKNFDEYIIEKLKVTKNKQLTLGDIYRIYHVNCSMASELDPEKFLKRIDDIFGINKLYELQNKYTDYFEEYEDNISTKIKNENANKLCKIILNIIFSVPYDMEIHDGLKQLIDACNIPPDKAKLLNISEFDTKLMYDNYLLVYFKFEER